MLEFVSFPGDTRPIGRRVAALCKHAKRTLGLKVLIVRDPTAEESLVVSLADRVAKQAELLSRRAGKE